MEGIWECERDPVEKSGSNQNPRKASGGKTMTMQWKVAAGVNELKCVSPSRNNNAQCHQQQCLLHTGCTLKCCNRNIGKLYPSVLYPGYISLEVWSVSIFELSTPSNTDPYLTNPLVPYKHQFLFSPFLSSTFSQSFHRRKNVINSSIISCTEPYFERRRKYGFFSNLSFWMQRWLVNNVSRTMNPSEPFVNTKDGRRGFMSKTMFNNQNKETGIVMI